jgi:hypothetical protein
VTKHEVVDPDRAQNGEAGFRAGQSRMTVWAFPLDVDTLKNLLPPSAYMTSIISALQDKVGKDTLPTDLVSETTPLDLVHLIDAVYSQEAVAMVRADFDASTILMQLVWQAADSKCVLSYLTKKLAQSVNGRKSVDIFPGNSDVHPPAGDNPAAQIQMSPVAPSNQLQTLKTPFVSPVPETPSKPAGDLRKEKIDYSSPPADNSTLSSPNTTVPERVDPLSQVDVNPKPIEPPAILGAVLSAEDRANALAVQLGADIPEISGKVGATFLEQALTKLDSDSELAAGLLRLALATLRRGAENPAVQTALMANEENRDYAALLGNLAVAEDAGVRFQIAALMGRRLLLKPQMRWAGRHQPMNWPLNTRCKSRMAFQLRRYTQKLFRGYRHSIRAKKLPKAMSPRSSNRPSRRRK